MMDKLLLKKRQLSEGDEQDEEASASPSTDIAVCSKSDVSGTGLQKVGIDNTSILLSVSIHLYWTTREAVADVYPLWREIV